MPHLPMLDGLRALAILIVMASHTHVTHLIPGGFGVTIFFFLSGYLITSLLRIEAAAHGRIDLRDFYWRRAVRIFPPLYITMALLLLAIAAGLLPVVITAPSLLLDGLFLTNYASALGVEHGLPIPFWSLDVEEHFYLLFSTVFAAVFVRMPARRAALWCLLGCGVVLALRIVNVAVLSDFSNNYYWSHTRLDSILFGCCLALWNNPALDRAPWQPRAVHVVAALGVLLACLQIRGDLFRETIRYSLQGAALFVVFSAALQDRGRAARALSWLPLRIVALLSYTLYLIHMPMALIVEQGLGVEHPLALHTITFALSFSYAGAMYLLVEQPLARWRRGRDSELRAIIAPALAAAPR
ncbi:peptidoglycan/LPS O-acetylase OafA/YrhL [Sphingomonas sp. BE138]|uniref:acyltransferase family protein n=1 Tax=Sphingomonas sp. BE138 TaxID=2817845 RepID=UPI00285AA0C4|nr:acyltransferase [Sphingomonas sp. BE138]MDR6789315.1 peptidoglycan/LPS O-acetylase OafA/YrhL [Sphingomonas sp. BE138]